MRLRKNRVPFESFLQKGTTRISVSTHLKKNRNSSFKTFILQLHSLLCTCTKKVQCENVMLLLENKKVLNLFFEKHRHPLATSLSLVPNCQTCSNFHGYCGLTFGIAAWKKKAYVTKCISAIDTSRNCIPTVLFCIVYNQVACTSFTETLPTPLSTDLCVRPIANNF